MQRIPSRVATGKFKAVTTDFILDSIAVVMEARNSPPSDIKKFFSSLILYKGLLIHSLGLRGRVMAADEMDSSGLDFDDATSVATMRRLGLKQIVSFDRDFDRVAGISRLEPKGVLDDV